MRKHTARWIVALAALALALGSGCDSSRSATRDDPAPGAEPQVEGEPPGEDDDDLPERMAKEHAGDEPVASGALTAPPAQPVTSTQVTYATVGGMPIQGYLAMPEGAAPGSLPALVVIHEWWGLNDNVRRMTDRLAGEGYVALAVDLYRGQTASEPGRAKSLMKSASARAGAVRENLRQATAWLQSEQGAQKIGVIGWCFGGGWSLQTGLLAPEAIDAVVVYYGRVSVPKEELAALDAPLLGLFGGKDQGIPPEDVRAFDRKLGALGKSAQIHIYDQAGHAFANPSGERYQPEAAEDAWQKTAAFLRRHLKP